MSLSRTPRRHLAAAVTAVMALTAGTALAVTPATAAPVPPPAQAAQAAQAAAAVATLAPGSQIVSAGTTGFLTKAPLPNGNHEARWTNYETGATTVLNALDTSYRSNSSDIVFANKAGSLSYWIHDMAHPSNVLTGISMNNGTYVRAALGSALLVTTADRNTGVVTVDLLRNTNGSTRSTPVTGFPADVRIGQAAVTTPGTAIVPYITGTGDAVRYGLAALDTFTGEIVERLPETTQRPLDASVSATHWSWVEYVGADRARLATVPRGGEGSPSYTDLGLLGGGSGMHTGLVGDWVTYARPNGGTAEFPSELYPLTARSLTDGGRTVKLLDHVSTVTTAPDGSLVASGGTVTEGEGVYRIAPDAEGTPTATLIATTNTPTTLTLVSQDVPAVVDLDKNGGKASFSWTPSRAVSGTVTLRHTRTGKSQDIAFASSVGSHNPTGKVTVEWNGKFDWAAAYNGDYSWRFRAKPSNGIGPELVKDGTFKVVRKPAAHDYSDNGTPDVLSRDSAGRLWRDDLVNGADMYDGRVASERKLIGSGWNAYSQVEAVGNVAGASVDDLVARDKDGNLWLYLGKGDGTFAPRTKIGPGWNAYNKITGGSDVNGDGWSDLFATDTTGVLWLYKGTGNWKAPYGGRTKVGGGWGTMNQITAVGDLAGTTHGDLLARDTGGVLWLYPGTGGTALGSRVRIGGGWGGYPHLVGSGDIDGDNRADLLAHGPSGTFFYSGTGNLPAPIGGRTGLPLYAGGPTGINLIA